MGWFVVASMSHGEGMVQEEQNGLWVSVSLISHVLTFGFLFFIPVFQTQTRA